ncbi:macrophage mannose receptor 1-like [Ara ararauna]
MYGNVEPSQEQKWVPGPGNGEEENPYEPLDPLEATPSQKHVPERAWPSSPSPKATRPVSPAPSKGCSKGKLALVATVALGLSVLMNILFLAIGSRRIAALTAELEAEKEKAMPNVASRSFLLYNEDHRKCIEANGHQLTATTCQPGAASQRFQWLQGGQLWGWQSQRCVTATRGQNLALVRLEPCRDDAKLQHWECRDGGLLALAGYDLYFNYGNNQQRTVMLYTGDGPWSRWVVHGSKDDVCSRSCCPPCSKGWLHFRNSCYFYSKTATSWENARRFCSLLGAQLLEVDGPEEKDHIRTMLQSSSWLGIRDEEVEGTWKRANGSVLSWESSSWHRSEPNGGRQENCAAVREDALWYDYPCTHQLPWVCEGHP